MNKIMNKIMNKMVVHPWVIELMVLLLDVMLKLE